MSKQEMKIMSTWEMLKTCVWLENRIINQKLTSRKILVLIEVLYVSNIRKNLISGAPVNRAGVKLVFKSNKIILGIRLLWE